MRRPQSYLRTQSDWEEHQAGQGSAGLSQLYLQQVRGLSLSPPVTTLSTVTSWRSSIVLVLVFLIPANGELPPVYHLNISQCEMY